MRKFISIIALALLCLPALAAKDSTAVSCLPSRFADNWFIQVGGGVNSVWNNGIGELSPTGEIYMGKWFTPALGLRAGALGYRNRPNGTQTGWFSGRDPFWFGHADIDLMWNLFNSFRYNEHRFWDVCPYLRAGAILTSQGEGIHVEPSAGLGIHNGLRLGPRADLYVEATAVAARETAYRQRGNIIVFPSATAGLVLRFGPTGFRRREAGYKETIIERRDTITIENTVVETVVDSVWIREMREHPLTLYFEIDHTVLTRRELDHLERYAHFVLSQDSRVLLTGSADKETGDPDHNQWLSEQRNAYIKDILIRVYGLKAENISEIANGDRKNEFRTPEQNRCVTISFIE